MKSVLISIQPKWCELIASGKKTVEVRKTRPKLETPFKCYIYCTQGEALAYPCLNNPNFAIHRTNNSTLQGRQMTTKEREQSDHLYANGKVIGEFVCDSIGKVGWTSNPQKLDWKEWYNEETCLTSRETYEYTKGELFYEWHISDLVIYDKPRELGEFKTFCKSYYEGDKCEDCKYFIDGRGYEYDESDCGCDGLKPIERPFQSWGYVESEG